MADFFAYTTWGGFVAANTTNVADRDWSLSVSRGIETTENFRNARRFASQAAITTFLSSYPSGPSRDAIQGGTGTPALQLG